VFDVVDVNVDTALVFFTDTIEFSFLVVAFVVAYAKLSYCLLLLLLFLLLMPLLLKMQKFIRLNM